MAIPIPLVDCGELEGIDNPSYLDIMDMRQNYKQGLLCPDIDKLELSGTPETMNYSLIEITIKGCTLQPD